ncbi:MAG: type II secretion system F family protein [Armatimonadota bacterium]
MDPLITAALGGSLVFGLLSVYLLVFARGPSPSERLIEHVNGAPRPQPVLTAEAPVGLRADPMPTVSHALQGTQFWEDLQLQLLRAGLLLRPSEALIIGATTTAVGLVAGWMLTGQLVMGIFAATLGMGAPYVYLVHRANKRQSAITCQLPNALDMLSSALRSGYALTRGFQVVATQTHPPIAEEFDRVLQEVQVGVSVTDALESMLARTDSYDLELVVAAMQTQLKLGGNLSEVLDKIAGVIRERVKLQGEIDAATSEGRLSATILVAMPIAMALLIQTINPGYLLPLVQEPVGIMMLVSAGLLMVAGIVIIRKMLEIEF